MWGSISSGFKYRPRLKVYQDGKNNEFDLETFNARSYRHWLYCTKIKGKIVFNNYNYSVTTNAHQSHLKDLLNKLGIKIDLQVSMHSSLSAFDYEALNNIYTEMFQIEIDGKTAKKPDVWVKCLQKSFGTRQLAISALKDHAKVCKKLGASISKEKIKSIKSYLVTCKAKQLENQRDKAKIRAALKKSLIPSLKNLDEIDLGFDKLSGLNEINLTGGF